MIPRYIYFALVSLIASHCASLASDTKVLLVAVGKYPHLESMDLHGSNNDVALIQAVALRYGATEQDIRVLSCESENPQDLSTRANIIAALEDLADKATKGQKIMIYLVGHGSRVPSTDPEEEDGQDEIFLAMDAQPGYYGEAGLPGTIRDKEFAFLFNKMTRKGAHVVFIADFCHSGTITRAGERTRFVPPDVLIQDAAGTSKPATPPRSSNARRGQAQSAWRDLEVGNETSGSLVVLAACHHFETTVENTFPDSDGPVYGLFTYHLATALLRSEQSLSYAQLIQAIYQDYRRMLRSQPSPLLEVSGISPNALFFSAEEGEREHYFYLQYHAFREQLRLNGGSLHGLTEGTILAVFDRFGSMDAERLIGHVEVQELDQLMSIVVPVSVESEEPPTINDLIEGRCRVLEYSYSPTRIVIALGSNSDADEATQLRTWAAALPETLSAHLDFDKPDEAAWRIELGALETLVVTTQAKSEADPLENEPNNGGTSEVGSISANEEGFNELIRKILKVHRLRQLAALVEQSGRSRILRGVQLNLHVHSDTDDLVGQPINPNPAIIEMAENSIISLVVSNAGTTEVDVNLFSIQSDLTITAHFGLDRLNRMQPTETLRTSRFRVTEPSGIPSELILIVTPAMGLTPLNLSFLAQDGFVSNRRTAETPLERFMMDVMDLQGTPAQGRRSALPNSDVTGKTVLWRVVNESE
ncbi:MAG: caspase family protein [Verrucomicrobiales bacterium]